MATLASILCRNMKKCHSMAAHCPQWHMNQFCCSLYTLLQSTVSQNSAKWRCRRPISWSDVNSHTSSLFGVSAEHWASTNCNKASLFFISTNCNKTSLFRISLTTHTKSPPPPTKRYLTPKTCSLCPSPCHKIIRRYIRMLQTISSAIRYVRWRQRKWLLHRGFKSSHDVDYHRHDLL